MSLPLFYAIYCLEAGAFFVIVPWTGVWTVNPLLHSNLAIGVWADNPFVRGFVSGIGIMHLMFGVRELLGVMRHRSAPRP